MELVNSQILPAPNSSVFSFLVWGALLLQLCDIEPPPPPREIKEWHDDPTCFCFSICNLYWFPRAVQTKCYKLSGLDNRKKVCCLSSTSYKSQIKVPARLVPAEAMPELLILPLSQLLAVCWQMLGFCGLQRHPTNPCLYFHKVLSCVHVCVQIPSSYQSAVISGQVPTLLQYGYNQEHPQ